MILVLAKIKSTDLITNQEINYKYQFKYHYIYIS